MINSSLSTCNPIRKHGGALTSSFTQLSNALARDPDLSAEAFRVYVLLLSHGDGYRESAVKIASRFGWGRQRVRKAIRELAEARLLVIQKHTTERGTRAFETYHIHVTSRFTATDVARLSEPQRLRRTDQAAWSNPDRASGLDRTMCVGTDQLNKEHHSEHKENTISEEYCATDGWSADLDAAIQEYAENISSRLVGRAQHHEAPYVSELRG